MTFRIVALYPDHLDLNGDQANLLVAKTRLAWLGYDVEVVHIQKDSALPIEANLIFIGHGSLAAWADINDSMTAALPWIENAIDNGAALMAVASGHEWAIKNGLLSGSANSTERVSKFEVADLDGLEVLGYLNSSTDAPIIQKKGLVFGTQLHGPVFAKNPKLTDSYLSEIAEATGVLKALDPLKNSELKNNADLVAGIVEQVWELERALASE